ncbi:type II toxin-antitoxin system antitoxin HipB [Escherichia coli]|nr:type II toxin-antitoxin system antitoxin HipB [Escherichia coli]
MMSFQKIYSPTQLANAMKLVRQQNGWTQSELAKKIGIKQATISNFENNPDNTTLAVERFDRRWNTERTVLLRLPQEDMCQTFGLPSSVKYESDGGPGIARIMAFLMGSSEALRDRYDFMKFQVFQWLIGATDGHAKNFSVFIQAGGSYRLTPFYDIISAFPVLGGTGIHISDLKLAMGLNASKGKKTAIDKIYPRHFLATAKVLRFPEVQMHEILSDFARMIPAALDNVKTSLPTDFPENVVTAVETNVLRLHGRLSREYGSK